MSRITGPKPRIRLARNPRLWLTGSASIVTFWSSSSFDSSSLLAKTGISVSNALVGLWSWYLKSCLNIPSTVAPVVETRSTLPARTCSRKVGLYGTRTDSTLPGANSATKT